MASLDDAISVLNRYLPEPYRIPDDRRQWWAIQLCAHLALLVVFSTLVLCVSTWVPDSDISLDSSFFLQSLDLLIPGLFLIQAYFVPMYFRHVRGRCPLWHFLGGTLLPAIVGLLFYPIYLYFLAKIWAQIMLIFALAASVLMFAKALIMHLCFRWWLAHNKPRDDSMPPLSGRL